MLRRERKIELTNKQSPSFAASRAQSGLIFPLIPSGWKWRRGGAAKPKKNRDRHSNVVAAAAAAAAVAVAAVAAAESLRRVSQRLWHANCLTMNFVKPFTAECASGTAQGRQGEGLQDEKERERERKRGERSTPSLARPHACIGVRGWRVRRKHSGERRQTTSRY